MEFIYQVETEPIATLHPEVTATALALLPSTLFNRFEEAVTLLDVALMNSTIEQMEPYQPQIVAGLRELTYNFQFAQLQRLIEEARANAQSTE